MSAGGHGALKAEKPVPRRGAHGVDCTKTVLVRGGLASDSEIGPSRHMRGLGLTCTLHARAGSTSGDRRGENPYLSEPGEFSLCESSVGGTE